jgi:propanol-preferring alcohol dehydrogenase
VIAVDVFDEKLSLAKELGATYTMNASKIDPVEEIKKFGGADVALCVAVSPKAFEQAFGSLRRGGTVVFVGLPGDQYVQLSIFAIVGNNIKIIGSTLGNRVDFAETFELQAAGKTKLITEARKLDQVNEAFEEVERGKARGSPRVRFSVSSAGFG